MKKIDYKQSNRFEKQIKKLTRKYRSLEEDLLEAQKAAIELFHLHHIDNQSVELIPKFDHKILQLYKLRKFACKALKGKGVKSGFRVIYAFYPGKSETSENLKVEYLEIYFKEKSDSDMDYKYAREYIDSVIYPKDN